MADILPNFKEGLFLSDSSPWPTPKRPIPVCGMGLQSSPPSQEYVGGGASDSCLLFPSGPGAEGLVPARCRSVCRQLDGLLPLLSMIFPVLLWLIRAFDNSHTVMEAQGGGEEQIEVEDCSQDGPHNRSYPEDL